MLPIKREKKTGKKIAGVVIIIIILIVMIVFGIKITPNYIKQDSDNIKLVINYSDVTNYLKADVYKDENGTIYLSKEDLANFYDEFIYYDEQYNQIVTTSNDKISVMQLNSNKKEVNGQELDMQNKILEKDNKYFIPFSEVASIYNVQMSFIEETNTVVLDSIDRELKQVNTTENVNIKYKSTIFSKTIEKIKRDDSLIIVPLTDEQKNLIPSDWLKVRTPKGNLGYVQSKYIANEKIVREAKKKEKQIEGKVSLVWDYFSEYATAPDRQGETIEGINVVSPSFFALEKLGQGNLLENVGTDGKNYIKWAHNNGYKVWPIISNNSMKETTSEIMKDYELRKTLINQIITYVKKYNLDGVNIDFEYMNEEDKALFSRFIIELTPRIKELGKTVSVDVTAPDGSPDWSLCFDRYTLGKVVDYMMFMAYDEYGASSPQEGTTAGGDWVRTNINKFLKQEEVPKEKLVLGIPFYTRLWKEKDGKIESTIVSMKKVDSVLPENVSKEWNETLKQNYVEYEKDGAIYKMWIEDEASIKEKLALINEFELAGGCYWVKDFETEGIWKVIKDALK